jgi:hypothetical protein
MREQGRCAVSSWKPPKRGVVEDFQKEDHELPFNGFMHSLRTVPSVVPFESLTTAKKKKKKKKKSEKN